MFQICILVLFLLFFVIRSGFVYFRNKMFKILSPSQQLQEIMKKHLKEEGKKQ